MNHPRHHPPDAMLMAHAAGQLSAGDSLLLACHLTLCPDCRARGAEHEAVAAALLPDQPIEESELDAQLRRVESRLDEPADATAPSPVYDPVLPAPLASLVGPLDQLEWRSLLPTRVAAVHLPIHGAGIDVRLLRLAPGFQVPDHHHQGHEHTLVLAGGYTDDQGRYQRGDLAIRAASPVHEQRIDAGEPCLALVAAGGPIEPTDLLGRLLSWFVTA